MFCSTIIPTIGRDSLSRAVESVLRQEFDTDQFEVIVVNDSGSLLPKVDWQRSEQVKIINTNRRERSFARNTGAAVARGKYLHFLDDDDWMAPRALEYFHVLSHGNTAKWLYGISQIVDQELKPLIKLHHGMTGNCSIQVMAGEWIPLQASLIEAESFFTVGGFNQHINGPEDIDLLRRIALRWDLAETPNLVANIFRGSQGSTTDYNKHPAISRWAREKILDNYGNYPRLKLAAQSEYWSGRLVRLYLTSALWNIRQGKFFVALDRAFLGTRALIQTGSNLRLRAYWRAITQPYTSFTFERGIENAKKDIV